LKIPPVNFVQIIGTQRSGSNLLRVMLHQSMEVVAPHPPHILKVFFPIINSYGNLSEKSNRLELATDILKLVDKNPVPWPPLSLNTESLAESAESLMQMFGSLYRQIALESQANTVCCKSLHNIFYSDQLESSNLQPRYIHIYRDGRDVAASFKHTPVGPKHIYFLAKKWEREQQACLDLKDKLGAKKVLQLKYEDLLNNPEGELQRVCDWLNIQFRKEMLEYYDSSASRLASGSGTMWQNLSKPLLRKNTGNYLKELSADEIEVFEKIAKNQLQELGYHCPEHSHSLVYSEEEIRQFTEQDKSMRESVQLQVKGIGKAKRKVYEDYIEELTAKAKRKTEIFQ